jgi:glycosyltransferase involved in cell wall biosynthesis
MRIWMVNHYAVPPGQAGPTRHYSFARELILRGHDVTVIASSFDHVCHREAHLEQGERHRYELIDGVPFLWFRTPSYQGNDILRVINMLAFAGRVWPFFRLRKPEKPDVIIGSMPTIFSALAALKLAHRLRVPFVIEVRDLWPESLIDFWNVSPAHPAVLFLRAIENYLYLHSEPIITLLPRSIEYFAEKGLSRGRIVWLSNGVDLSLVPPPNDLPGNDIFTVMYVGNHGHAQGLDVLLDAAAALQRDKGNLRIHFRLIGDGPEKKRLQARAEREGIGIVRFEGPVPKRRIYPILQEADAFLMILKDVPVFRRGTSPNKLFDYLVSARPIIFSGDTSFDYVTQARAGLTVPPGDGRALAAAVTALANTPFEVRRQMGLHGRSYVENNFNIQKLAGGLEKLLLQVIGE